MEKLFITGWEIYYKGVFKILSIHNFRFYTRHFENNETTAQTIANYALKEHHNWINAIRKWQKPILDDGYRKQYLKTSLHELNYFFF